MPLRANVPEIRQGLISPGLKKFGRGASKLAKAYMGGLANVAKMPGDAYRGRQFTPEETLSFTLAIMGGGGMGKGGFGSGARRIVGGRDLIPQKLVTQRRVGPSVSLKIKKSSPDEEVIIKQLLEKAKEQHTIGKTKSIADKALKYREMLGAMDKDWL